MAENYVDLQDEVLDHQLSDTKYRPLVKRWLNEAQRYIYLQTDLRTGQGSATYATSAGSASPGAIPTDYLRKRHIHNDTQGTMLTPISQREYDAAPDQTGSPTRYLINGSTLYVYPTPDAAYTLTFRYYKLPDDMVADGDFPSLPQPYRHLLVRYALYRAFQRENDYESANYFQLDFEQGLMKLRGEGQYEGQDGPIQTEGTYPYQGPTSGWY